MTAKTKIVEGAQLVANAPKTYDVMVYQDATRTYAIDRNGTILSSGLISANTDDVQVQAAITYLDGLSDANASGRGMRSGFHLHIGIGSYKISATLYMLYPHLITGDGYTASEFVATGAVSIMLSIGCTPVYTAGAGTSGTQIVCAGLPSSTNDYYNGFNVYNITRDLMATATDYNGGAKTLTVSIAGSVSTDTFIMNSNMAYTAGSVTIRDLGFTGSGIANIGVIFSHWKAYGSVSQCLFERCMFRRFNQYGVYDNASWGTTYRGCEFVYIGSEGTDPGALTVFTAGAGTNWEYIMAVTPDLPGTTDGYYDGWYLWNITRGSGTAVSTFVHTGHVFRCNDGTGFGAAETDTFVLIPPWAGIHICGSNASIIDSCAFEGSYNGISVRSCTGLSIRNVVIEGNIFNGILIRTGNGGTYLWQPTHIVMDNVYLEANGSYNNTNATTYGLHNLLITDQSCQYITIRDIISTEGYLTAARNSSGLYSLGHYVRVSGFKSDGTSPSTLTGDGSEFSDKTPLTLSAYSAIQPDTNGAVVTQSEMATNKFPVPYGVFQAGAFRTVERLCWITPVQTNMAGAYFTAQIEATAPDTETKVSEWKLYAVRVPAGTTYDTALAQVGGDITVSHVTQYKKYLSAVTAPFLVTGTGDTILWELKRSGDAQDTLTGNAWFAEIKILYGTNFV